MWPNSLAPRFNLRHGHKNHLTGWIIKGHKKDYPIGSIHSESDLLMHSEKEVKFESRPS